jgi:elongation factor Tu
MPTDPAFQMTVEDVFSIRDRGTVGTGRVGSGTLRVGDEIVVQGRGIARKTVVTAIEMFRKTLEQAKAGDSIGVLLKNVRRDDTFGSATMSWWQAGPISAGSHDSRVG